MSNIYIVSLSRRAAIRHNGGTHHMTLRAAARRFADDALVVRYSGNGPHALDMLKRVSQGPMMLSKTELDLIARAA